MKKAKLTYDFIPEICKYLSNKPVLKGFLFGSYARKEAKKNSDIDLLVEVDYSKPVSLLDFIGWGIDLEKITNKKVDLVAADGLSIYLKPYIEEEKIMIYEKS